MYKIRKIFISDNRSQEYDRLKDRCCSNLIFKKHVLINASYIYIYIYVKMLTLSRLFHNLKHKNIKINTTNNNLKLEKYASNCESDKGGEGEYDSGTPKN